MSQGIIDILGNTMTHFNHELAVYYHEYLDHVGSLLVIMKPILYSYLHDHVEKLQGH